jgi:glycosyltransferase involved in cell wall biosynthesis
MDYFKYIDNFAKTSSIESILIKGNLEKEKPFITILIPTYRRADLLKEAIDSALDQYEFDDYEIIILDNDPTRNNDTEKLLEKYDNEKIFYYKNMENLGIAGNWNRILLLARSLWIVFLHDDDIMSPYFLSSCVHYLSDSNIAILKFQCFVFSIEYPQFSRYEHHEKITLRKKLALKDFILGCPVGSPSNGVYNKTVVVKMGGFNSDFFPAFEYVLSARCAEKYMVHTMPLLLGGYRLHQVNESLNKKTMDLYFKQRFAISSAIMRKLKYPNWLIKIIHSVTYENDVKNICMFFRMHNYKLELENFNFIRVPHFISKLLALLFLKVLLRNKSAINMYKR